MGNLAYDFFDFAQKAAQELMLHEADEWKRGVMNEWLDVFMPSLLF